MRALCVSIHDVAPRTFVLCRKIAEAVAGIDEQLPLTLLVVPCYHGATDEVPRDYGEWIDARLARGDELALHGYTHLDQASAPGTLAERLRRCVYTAREGEFSALTRDEAAERIARGRLWFAEHGWPVHGFVAPAWLVSEGTWEALQRFDFAYTTTLTRFHLPEARASVRAPTVVYSAYSVWRRIASRRWNAALVASSRRTSLVRFGFHPVDAEHPELMAHALALLDRLRRERAALTKFAFARAVEPRLRAVSQSGSRTR